MIVFIASHLYCLWLAATVLFVIIEAVTFNLTTIWAAASSVILVFISLTGIAFSYQIVIFLFLTIVFVVFTRPFVVKKLRLGAVATNVSTVLGQEVVVVKEISRFSKGTVRTRNGVEWTAELSDDVQETAGEGCICSVSGIEGNTLKVKLSEKNV